MNGVVADEATTERGNSEGVKVIHSDVNCCGAVGYKTKHVHRHHTLHRPPIVCNLVGTRIHVNLVWGEYV